MARAEYITGYQIAAIDGRHPHLTQLELWAELTGRREKEDRTDRMILSAHVNPAIARAYAEIRKRYVEPGWMTHHPEKRLAAARPTALVWRTVPGSIEASLYCQRTSPWQMADWGEPDTDEVPEHVLMRATWEAGVVGVPRCDVVVPSSGIAVYPIDFDETYFDELYDSAERFWCDHVIADKAPPATMRDEDVLRALYRKAGSGSVPIDADLLTLYDEARAREKEGAASKKAAKVAIMHALGTASLGQADGWTCTYRNNKGSPSTDWKNLARKLGATDDQIAEFTTTKPGPRVLRVKKAGNR
jgi:predicted phage-related endonuclease